ncbi:MAG: nucleotide pyrophosphohydrolase [Candidatus Absconditabacteria bacterium]
MEITELQKHILDFRDERDWAQFHNPKDLSASIAVEAAELQEKFLRLSTADAQAKGQQDPEVADELADVINNCLLFAEACNIDVAQACLQKLEHNKAKYPVDKSKGSAKKYTEYQSDLSCKIGEKGYE